MKKPKRLFSIIFRLLIVPALVTAATVAMTATGREPIPQDFADVPITVSGSSVGIEFFHGDCTPTSDGKFHCDKSKFGGLAITDNTEGGDAYFGRKAAHGGKRNVSITIDCVNKKNPSDTFKIVIESSRIHDPRKEGIDITFPSDRLPLATVSYGKHANRHFTEDYTITGLHYTQRDGKEIPCSAFKQYYGPVKQRSSSSATTCNIPKIASSTIYIYLERDKD
jgi:hypothetical protein